MYKTKAVIFDQEGVIIDTAFLQFESYRTLLKRYNVSLTLEEYKEKMSGRKAVVNLRRVLGHLINDEEIPELLKEKDIIFFRKFKSLAKKIPGLGEFLKKLRESKIRIALASSSRRKTVDFVLNYLKINNFFAVIITSEDVSKAKPDPELYLKAAKKLHTKPSDCVVFEDSLAGVQAAKRAGMKVILVTTSHSYEEIPTVDLAIEDFTRISVKDLKML